MESKAKLGMQRDDSWGEIKLHTTHKPGMIDIRPASKTTNIRHSHHPQREAVILKTLSAEFFEPPSLPALRAKLAAAKQQAREQRYIPQHPPRTPPTRYITEHSRRFDLQRKPRQMIVTADDDDRSSRCSLESSARRAKSDRELIDYGDYVELTRLLIALVRIDSALLRYSIRSEMLRAVSEKEDDSGNYSSACSLSAVNVNIDVLDILGDLEGLDVLEQVDEEEECESSLSLHSSTAVLKLSVVFEPDYTNVVDVSCCESCNFCEALSDIISNHSNISLSLENELNSVLPVNLVPPSSFSANMCEFFQNMALILRGHTRLQENRESVLKMPSMPALLGPLSKTKHDRMIGVRMCESQTESVKMASCKSCDMLDWYLMCYAPAESVRRSLPCAYTQAKMQITQSSQSCHLCCLVDEVALLEHCLAEGDSRTSDMQPWHRRRHRGYEHCVERFYYPYPYSNAPARGRLKRPVLAHSAYTTRTTYIHYLRRWRDAIGAIAKCASLLVRFNHATEVMWRRDCDSNRKQNEVHITDSWLSGGSFGSRTSVLIFRSSALAQASEADISCKPGHKLHITFRVVQAETKLLAKLLECHGILEASSDSQDFNILWTGSHPKPGILRSMAQHQRVNHFPRSYELTRKDRLYKNIEKMQHAKGLKHFDFIPQTFLMPTEYRELCTTHHRVKGPWIVKPAASSRGRGIYIVESPNQVPIEEPVVVAKYISKPLLIKGHKCDLRLYVAVTSFDPLLIYIYEEGMVRFATVKYDTTHKQLWNPCMHLCNYSINKYHSDYVKSDDPSAENVGHKWTLSALLRHLKSCGKDTAALMTQVEDLVIKAILSCGNSIVTACKMFVPNPVNCFELYGFDILIDENLKPWLLEVNLSPSLGCDSPLDVRLKSAMLADLLTLVGIPAVDPMIKPSSPANTASSKSLKMKISNCRRIHSAEGLSNHTLPKKASKGSVSVSNSSLSAEDNKMIKNAKGQFLRRGGFVRIFPAVDSWTKYAQYLDTITGIPIAGSTSSIPFSFMGQHNNNQILYKTLYPDMVITPTLPAGRPDKHQRISMERKRDGSLDSVRRSEGPVSTPRQDRYERKLSQGHRSTLGAPKKPLQEDYSAELKRQVCDMVKNGKKLSQVEARKAFSQYLMCVLKRISSSADQDGHIEIVLKFLQKASSYLKNPFYVKIPSHKLSDKDRAAIVAKQLNDFLYLYNRETDLYADLDRPSQIPKNVFNEFLEHTSESDLEELLILQNIHTVPNSKGDSHAASSFQGLLRCLPSINSTCFSSPEAAKKPVKVTPLS